MLDPSSSEDTGGESDPEVVQEPPRKPAASSAGKRGSSSRGQQRQPAAPGGAPGKGAKDGDATGEEEERKERERIQKEEEERKIKLQIYVFVLRCVAYPFNAKQPTDMARRQQKVSVPHAETTCTCCLVWRDPLPNFHWKYVNLKLARLLCLICLTNIQKTYIFVIFRSYLLIRHTFDPP